MDSKTKTDNIIQFMGKTPKYWLELQRRADELNVSHLVNEIAELGGKIMFYERRIKEMNDLMTRGKDD